MHTMQSKETLYVEGIDYSMATFSFYNSTRSKEKEQQTRPFWVKIQVPKELLFQKLNMKKIVKAPN